MSTGRCVAADPIRILHAVDDVTSTTTSVYSEDDDDDTTSSSRIRTAPAPYDDDAIQTTTIKETPAMFQQLARHVADTLQKSDAKRDTGFDGASTGWTSWIDEASAAELQTCWDRVRLRQFDDSGINHDDDDDDVRAWLAWLWKGPPAPLWIELSPQLRHAVDDDSTASTTTTEHLPSDDDPQSQQSQFLPTRRRRTRKHPTTTTSCSAAWACGSALAVRYNIAQSAAHRARRHGLWRAAPGRRHAVSLDWWQFSSKNKRRAGERTAILVPAAPEEKNRVVGLPSIRAATTTTRSSRGSSTAVPNAVTRPSTWGRASCWN